MSDVLRKSVPVEIKATNDATGQVEALVAVFGNVDLGGDKIVPGAFERSLREWKRTGDPIPVIFNHEWGDLWAHIGVVDDAKETEKGLLVRYTLDVKDNPAAAQVYRLMKRRSLREHSFAYGIPKGGSAMTDEGVMELRDLDIFEVGPTLKGMNPDTELLSVKSALEKAALAEAATKTATADTNHPAGQGTPPADPPNVQQDEQTGVKAGRVLSKANEAKLRGAMDAIAAVLSSLGEEKPEKSSDEDETGTNAVDAAEAGGKSSGTDPDLLALMERIRLFNTTS